MSRLYEGINKYVSKYLSTRIVFLMDVTLCVISTLLVAMFTNIFFDIPFFGGRFLLISLLSSGLFAGLMFYLTRVYRMIIRHFAPRDLIRIFVALLGRAVLMTLLVLLLIHRLPTVIFTMLAVDLLLALVLLVAVRLVMIVVFETYKQRLREDKGMRVLVYGTGDKSVAAITRLQNSPHYKVVGFLEQVPKKTGTQHLIADKPVYTFTEASQFDSVRERTGADGILFTTEAEAQANQELINHAITNHVKTLIIPTVDEVIDGKVMQGRAREVRIEDLLGRSEIKISLDEIKSSLQDKVVMVTGAAGSIGSELCRQIASFNVLRIILFDNAETPMHNLRLELEERYPKLEFVPVIGDVRSEERLDYCFRKWRPQVVFHAAAYKHVPLMEENPCEAVRVNCNGSRTVADKCIQFDVEKMVMISTDKAVNPTNIMGCSKRIAEIYVQSLGLAIERGEVQGKTKFVTTRFGNVLGSNGSVIPRFRDQIERGGPVTVTHPEITRFFMTIPEACRLVLEAATLGNGNQIFVFDMGKSVKIDTLARRMIELAGFEPGKDIQIEYTGLRPGEKLYEEVLSNAENTLPTPHDRIRIARVREYDYAAAAQTLDELKRLATEVDIPSTVKLMKAFVPEFKSKNSRFAEYDK
ncbi:MAG: polysaccharide biosynthesis protein [Bacteroidales bacterium]|nr:polysaccharide biosynthesis protein [Bacteroidales bacterium]